MCQCNINIIKKAIILMCHETLDFSLHFYDTKYQFPYIILSLASQRIRLHLAEFATHVRFSILPLWPFFTHKPCNVAKGAIVFYHMQPLNIEAAFLRRWRK